MPQFENSEKILKQLDCSRACQGNWDVGSRTNRVGTKKSSVRGVFDASTTQQERPISKMYSDVRPEMVPPRNRRR